MVDKLILQINEKLLNSSCLHQGVSFRFMKLLAYIKNVVSPAIFKKKSI